MSAPQAGNQNGKPPKPPAPFLRRSTAGSPFVQRRRPPPSRPAQGALSAAGFSSAGFSSAAARKGNVPNGAPPAGATAQFGAAPSGYSLPRFDALRAQFGGWTEPPPPGVPYTDYPLRTTKKELRDGMRFHVMRLMRSKVGPGEKPVDPTDQTEFTRPVSLHRRDPRQPPLGRAVKEEDQNAGRPPPAPIDEKEAERLAQLKAEKEAQRAADLAQIAPVQREPKPKVQTQQKKKEKLTQITTQPRTEESRKEAELRYEEALPWHLEDADGKNVWVGSYVAALSETNVALVVDNESSAFRMIPLEKWYRFTAKPPFNPYSIEEAEKLMSKRVDVGRWVMRDKEKEREQKEMEEMRKYIHGPTKIKTESSTFRAASRSEKMDVDDVDISGDEFQDDDEAPYEQVEVDEDEKDARERIRREQLGANLFGDADEREVEKEEEDAKKEELQRKLFGKKMKKALTRRENQLIYESDSSEADPFASSSSDDESSEEEYDKEKEKEDESKAAGKADGKEKDKGTPKGSATPQGKSKPLDGKKGKSLKRPGSPNMSESSGNESSRKKPRKQAALASGRGSRATTPLPGAGPSQPQRPRMAAGFTSDGDGTAGEMSDGPSLKKKIKIVGAAAGAKESPAGSRAGSPVPSAGAPAAAQLAPGQPASTVSPTKGGASPARGTSPSGPIEASEIVAALPPLPAGISIGNLMKVFMSRVGDNPGQMPRKDWIKLVKENAVYGPDKLLRRKS